jgi:hypothetical protein
VGQSTNQGHETVDYGDKVVVSLRVKIRPIPEIEIP